MSNINKNKKYHFIYKTTNFLNETFYIGMHSTSNIDDGYIGSGKRLGYSINKYGRENFKCEILEYLPDRDSLAKREKEIVNDELLDDNMCMNLQPGGGGGFCDKKHQLKCAIAGSKAAAKSGKNRERINWLLENDSEWRKKLGEKISKANTGNPAMKSFKGKHHTEETKRKISKSASIAQKGERNSQFGSHWINNGKENKKLRRDEILPNGWRLGKIKIK